MKKVYRQRLLKFAALVIPILLIVLLLQQYVFVYNDANTERIRKFYCEEENSLDVVLLGASEVMAGYSPGYAYDQYGYTSYMYAMDSNIGSLYTAQLKEILAHQDPDLLIVEVYGFTKFTEDLNSELKYRTLVENIPLSKNKLDIVWNFNCNNKLNALLPFLNYHGDFKIVRKQLQYLEYHRFSLDSPSLIKGMVTESLVYSGPGDDSISDGTNDKICEEAKAYLVEFLQYCQQEKLDNVVFVNLPRYYEYEDQSDLLKRVDNISQIVTQYGFPFWDLQKETEQIGLDVQTDFYNAHHLNVYGQQKLTNYLGNWIINEHNLVPREQSSENIQHWQKAAQIAEKFHAYAKEETAAGKDTWLVDDVDTLKRLDQYSPKR